MREIALIERLRRWAGPARGLKAGIGDDCAILRPAEDADLLLTTDLLIEDVHFHRDTHTAADLGHKALARGLSDIAAMGGLARFCLVSLALPPWASARWVEGFYRGLLALAKRWKVALAGGDLARSARLACDIVVAGWAPRGAALKRDGARAGHAIFVTGELGGSALGLKLRSGPAWRRHLRPQPRLEQGAALRKRFRVSAAMDITDGLSLDLHRLALASGVEAHLDGPLPLFPGASIEQALHGGEDYELLFTAPAGARLPKTIAGVAVTRIGEIRAGKPGRVLYAGKPLPPLGYDHFRSS